MEPHDVVSGWGLAESPAAMTELSGIEKGGFAGVLCSPPSWWAGTISSLFSDLPSAAFIGH